MFVKVTMVRRGGRVYEYLQMVEGYRDERGRVRQRVVANLGRRDALKESGPLEALAGSFARLDPPLAGVRREAGRLHVDLTTLRVAGAYEHSALVAKGWAPERRVERQVRALQATSADGVSLYVRPDPGNAAEVALIGASLERLRELAGPGLIVCDSACGHPKTLARIARSGLSFIVPLRASSGFRERFLAEGGHEALGRLAYVSERERKRPQALRTRYRGALRGWQITDPESGEPIALRLAHIHSSEEQRETAAARERALSKAEQALERLQRGLGGRHHKTRRPVEARAARVLAGQPDGLIP